jgi:hypothetical protein
LVGFSASALAGPPFQTDDPEPVEYRQWEVYVASQGNFGQEETSLTAPHVELNYGLLTNVQIHLLAPFEFEKQPGDPSHYGFGDVELGAKFRFLQESSTRPQMGVFPLVLIPTGDTDHGLGSGQFRVFLPVWIQKSFGSWETYGGGGSWINPGKGNRNYEFLGWEAQRDITKRFTLGAELFYQTPSEVNGESSLGFNVGSLINFSDLHHLLISAGRDILGPDDLSFYAGYQLTFGP